MKSLPPPILSSELRASDIPAEFKSWSAVIEFAATFSPHAELKENEKPKGIAEMSVGATVKEIRAALFHEYRRYNHFGYEPPEEVKQQCIQAITVLRTKAK
jgi:hypothetical protein